MSLWTMYGSGVPTMVQYQTRVLVGPSTLLLMVSWSIATTSARTDYLLNISRVSKRCGTGTGAAFTCTNLNVHMTFLVKASGLKAASTVTRRIKYRTRSNRTLAKA